jgi:hypothetical protein
MVFTHLSPNGPGATDGLNCIVCFLPAAEGPCQPCAVQHAASQGLIHNAQSVNVWSLHNPKHKTQNLNPNLTVWPGVSCLPAVEGLSKPCAV